MASNRIYAQTVILRRDSFEISIFMEGERAKFDKHVNAAKSDLSVVCIYAYDTSGLILQTEQRVIAND
jgi:hypothetical protein